jgi:hypothetical protein
MLDRRKYEIFIEMQQHNCMIFTKIVTVDQVQIISTWYKDACMIDGRKCEIFLKMQQHNCMIFNLKCIAL